MAPEKEITAHKHIEEPISDQEILFTLDDKFRTSYTAFMDTHATINWHMQGDEKGYEAASRAYSQAMTIDPDTHVKLTQIANSGHTSQARIARKLLSNSYLHTDGSAKTAMFSEWQAIRKKLEYTSLKGQEVLSKALEDESNPNERQAIYHALHDKDTTLAEIFLSKWRAELSVKKQTEKQRIIEQIREYDETAENSQNILRLVQDTQTQASPLMIIQDQYIQKISGSASIYASDSMYWSKSIMNKHDFEFSDTPINALMNCIQALGHEDLFKNITILVPDKRHGSAVHITQEPGHTSVVIAHTNGSVSLRDRVCLFHEAGHGMHNASMSKNLLFSELYGYFTWSEAMAFLYEDLLLEPTEPKDQYHLNSLRSVAMYRRLESLRMVLLNLRLDFILRSDTEASLEFLAANASIAHSDLIPLIKNAHPYRWANDMYVMSYPFYGINYLYGWMIAAQIRAWWRRTHTEPILSKSFGDFLRTQCYPPGNSIPWREQLKTITGEDIHPSALLRELSAAKDICMEDASSEP